MVNLFLFTTLVCAWSRTNMTRIQAGIDAAKQQVCTYALSRINIIIVDHVYVHGWVNKLQLNYIILYMCTCICNNKLNWKVPKFDIALCKQNCAQIFCRSHTKNYIHSQSVYNDSSCSHISLATVTTARGHCHTDKEFHWYSSSCVCWAICIRLCGRGALIGYFSLL